YTNEVAGSGEAGEIHVAELVASGDHAPSSTLRVLLSIPHPEASNHYGGQLQFGPEGDLFISTGDGGGANDSHHNAQSLSSLLGKILRIDPDQEGVLPYTVPAGNPFPKAPPPFDAIWSYGLRNPYRFSFDRATGAIAIGDVGQARREEVDYAPAPGRGGGADYGWNCLEGTLPGPEATRDPECETAPPGGFVAPIFEYPHEGAPSGDAMGCAIIGGYVARNPGLPELAGRYLYGDFCTGEVRSISVPSGSGDRSERVVVPQLVSFGEDSCGRLYTVSDLGQVSRLVEGGPQGCNPPLRSSFAGIRAVSRRVRRGGRALLTVWVSPCAGRQGERIRLFRGRRPLGHRRLSRACTARFLPRVRRRSGFRAKIGADATFSAATSRVLRIRPERVPLRRPGS
ncbi:MAG: PQQ-dependent sugar dehydrogenase, partial [Syntrophothermus sp.]